MVYPSGLVGSEGRGDGFVGFGDTLVVERGAGVDYGCGAFHVGLSGGGDADSEADNIPLVGLDGGGSCDGLEHRGLRNVNLENGYGGGGQAPMLGKRALENGVCTDASV